MRNINYAFLPPGIVPSEKSLEFKDVSMVVDDFERVCSLVFVPNPKTLLPSSDLDILFSDAVPPEIADWVRRNLQTPQNGGVSSLVNGEQIDDDTLIALTRNYGEDSVSYINRCNSLIKQFMSNNGEGS